MSSTVGFNLTIPYGTANNYLVAGSAMTLNYSSGTLGNAAIGWNTLADNNNIYATYNDTAKARLFPNGTAHPIYADISFKDKKVGGSECSTRFRINGSGDLFVHNCPNDWSVATYSGLTNSEILSSTKSSSIQWWGHHMVLTGGGATDLSLTLYFTRYDFSATAGTGVTSASVSSSTGYDGDSITFSCVIPSGYVFDGWYSGSTLVSSSQSYTHTVNGADLTLTAKAHQQVVAKSLSATYNGSQLQGFPISVTADTPISYNGTSKGTVPLSGGAKTFKCADRIANGNIVIGAKTLSCANKLMRTNVIACIAKNLLNTNDFSLSNVSVADGIYTFQPNTTAMISQSLPTPVAGHKFYGRCYQKAPSGSTFLDGRFEYYYTDGANLIFASMSDTARDNQWHLHSQILSLPSIASPSGWVLRSFTVSGTAAAYRKEMMIVDLTDMFGAGNEPDKAWCDANL